MKSILSVGELKGKYVLVRVDWNVPIKNGKVEDDSRIHATLSTLHLLEKEGARIIVMSHIESEEGTLLPVYQSVENVCPISFCESTNIDDIRECVGKLKDGEIMLLENLRKNRGEKSNSPEFAKELASLGDIYINEAFSASHRRHASIVGVPKLLPSYTGIQFEEEFNQLSKALNPEHPFLFILGGAKFETKLPLLEKFTHIADDIFVGGALAHNFFKESGMDIKDSLVSDGDFHIDDLMQSRKIILPQDPIWEGEKIVDAGPLSIKDLKEKIKLARFILWNGPLGLYEKGHKEGTKALAKALAGSTATTIVGGADTRAAITDLEIESSFTFLSTAGGAMLDFLATGTLPGIDALN